MSYAFYDVPRIVLGMIVQESGNLARVLSLGVTADCFEDPELRAAFNVVVETAMEKGEFRLPMLAPKHMNLLGVLGECRQMAPIAQNVEHYAHELLAQTWQMQSIPKLADLSRKILDRKPWDPMDGVLAELRQTMTALVEKGAPPKLATYEPIDLAEKWVDEWEKTLARAKLGKTAGLTTGLRYLDRVTGGWMPGSFNVLGARTSHGKTTLALNFAYYAALAKAQVAYFTIEMRATRILGKLLSRISGVRQSAVATARDVKQDEVDRLHNALARYSELGLRVNDKAGRTIEAIEAEAWKLRQQGKLDFLIVDYIQQLGISGKRFNSRQAELTEVTARLQDLAHRLEIPLLLLAQLNRQADQSDGPPTKSMLKDSGSIEQDADVILLIHRQRHDDPTGPTWLIVEKNRDGRLGPFAVDVDFRVNRFSDANVAIPED